MGRYAAKRIVLLLINLVVIFVMMYVLFMFATYVKFTHLPLWESWKLSWHSFQDYLADIRVGDFGESRQFVPYDRMLLEAIPLSLKINAVALLFYVFGGIVLGIVSALFHDRFVDHAISATLFTIGSVPIHIMMMISVLVFGYYMKLIPYQFAARYGAWNYVLPVFVLSLVPMANITRLVRGELIESWSSEYVLLAQTKGLNKRQILVRHSLRNSILPVIGELPGTVLYALMGSFFVELIYGIQGIGRLMYFTIIDLTPHGTRYVIINTKLLVLIMMFYTTISLTINLISDLLMHLIDPRVRITE